MSEIKLFEKEEFGKVRVVMQGEDPWFVAKDVCGCLEIGNSRDAVASLDDDEKGVGIIDTPGGKQEMSIVSEPGLYSLILRSRKPEAKAFKRWVTHDILPSIRKTGGYLMAKPNDTPEAILARAVLVAQDTIRRIEAERDEAIRTIVKEHSLKSRSALILLKRMSKPPFLDRFGGFALSRGCPDPELIAVSAGSFNEANVLEPHRR